MYKLWRKGMLVCYGDNQVGHRLKQGSSSERVDCPCDDACPFRKLKSLPADESKEKAKQRTCEPEGTLRVRIDGLPTMDHFEVTARISSIIRVSPFLNTLACQCARQSELQGRSIGLSDVPLILKLVPEKMEGYGEFYVLQLDIRESLPRIFRGIASEDRPEPPGTTDPPAEGPPSGQAEKPQSPFTEAEQDEIRHLLPAVEANHQDPGEKAAARAEWAEKITQANGSRDKQTAATALHDLRVEAHRGAPGPRKDQKTEAEQLLGRIVNQDTAQELLVEIRSASDQDAAEEILTRIRKAATE